MLAGQKIVLPAGLSVGIIVEGESCAGTDEPLENIGQVLIWSSAFALAYFTFLKAPYCQIAMAQHADNSGELKAVLVRLVQLYSSCGTYEDQGAVRESMPDESGQEQASEDFFTTAFDRNARRFRYEFRTGGPQTKLAHACIVWRNGDSVKIWTELSARIESTENIGLAVAGALGNSGESAFLIPNLLAPEEIGGRGLLGLEDLRLAGDARFNNCDCFKISGCYPSGSKLTVWVDMNTFLILRAEEETAMTLQIGPKFRSIIMGSGPLVTKTIITYSPRVNTLVPAAKFEMLVPEK